MANAINVKGHLYPNLFAYDIADLHTFESNDKLVKTNCYSTYFDLISGKQNKPVVYRNFALMLASYVTEMKVLKNLFTNMRKIKSQMDVFFDTLKEQVDSGEWETGSVRAEFRLRLCDAGSMMPLIDHIFSLENIKLWTCIFRSSTITRLAKYYIYSFQVPMIDNYMKVIRQYESRRVRNVEIMEHIATISILESLLTATLFSGMTYSFSSELVWNRSREGCSSLELMNFVKSHNRPVFRESFFTDGVFKIVADYSVLERAFKKITRNSVFQFPPIELMLQFNDADSSADKADVLWKIYFSELNPNAFRVGNNQRWKLESLNRNVITEMSEVQLTFIGAVKAIFHFLNFSKFGSWKNKIYMSLASDWVTEQQKVKNGLSLADIERLLMASVRKLEIQHIHYVGTQNYNGNSARHVPLNWTGQSFQEIATTNNGQLSDVDAMRLARQSLGIGPIRWLDFDISLLVDGINRYHQSGRQMFNFIYGDGTLNFRNRREPAKLRTKWNELRTSGRVICEAGNWYLPGSQPQNGNMSPIYQQPRINDPLPLNRPALQIIQVITPPEINVVTNGLNETPVTLHFTPPVSSSIDQLADNFNEDYHYDDHYDDYFEGEIFPASVNIPTAQERNVSQTVSSDSLFNDLRGTNKTSFCSLTYSLSYFYFIYFHFSARY